MSDFRKNHIKRLEEEGKKVLKDNENVEFTP